MIFPLPTFDETSQLARVGGFNPPLFLLLHVWNTSIDLDQCAGKGLFHTVKALYQL